MASSAKGSWPTAPLGSLALKVRSGATPKGGQTAYLAKRSRYALIRSQNVLDHQFDVTGLAHISDAQAAELRGAEANASDVLLNITGDGKTFGRACVVPKQVLPACVNQHVMLIRPDERRLNSDYLAAWLALPDTKEYIESFNAGGSRRAITKGHIESFEVPLPTLDIQRDIGSMAAAINLRIESLLQLNTTLEAIAQALFKSWFVDFDPVRAKADGREPEGMDAVTAVLFPSEFEESELGLIPEGWRVVPFGDAVAILGGGTPKTSVAAYWDGSIPWFSVVDAPASGQVFTLDTVKKVTRLGLENCSAKLLPPLTTIISARGTVGKVALTGCDMAMNQSCYGLRPKVAGGESFVYFSTVRFVDHLKRIAHGAVFDTITRSSFDQVSACVPPDDLLTCFGKMTAPLLERIRTSGLQTKSLIDLRDTLLPRLISGNLRLPEAEAQLVSSTQSSGGSEPDEVTR